jgi:radical SAM protein with 4Fe4S-binding SPASM domain
MPFSDFLGSIQPLKKKYPGNSITVVMTGGEPLLRKDIFSCGKTLREHGFRWGMVTNGYHYTEEIHGQLHASGIGAVTLSMDGMKEHHNWLRNNSLSFDRAVAAMELLVSSKRICFDVVTCVNTRNLSELPELMDFLIKKGVKTWRLFTIAPIGRAKTNIELTLGPEELIFLMDFIKNARRQSSIEVKFSCEAFVGGYEMKIRDSFFFCRAGINIASVLADGSISACPNVNRSFAQGNIYSDDLLEVWENGFEIMRNRDWTKTGLCSHCSDFKDCQGGALHLWDQKRECVLVCLNHEIGKTQMRSNAESC